jgi:hypothetical protein
MISVAAVVASLYQDFGVEALRWCARCVAWRCICVDCSVAALPGHAFSASGSFGEALQPLHGAGHIIWLVALRGLTRTHVRARACY